MALRLTPGELVGEAISEAAAEELGMALLYVPCKLWFFCYVKRGEGHSLRLCPILHFPFQQFRAVLFYGGDDLIDGPGSWIPTPHPIPI